MHFINSIPQFLSVVYLTFLAYLFFMVIKTLYWVARYLRAKTALLEQELEENMEE